VEAQVIRANPFPSLAPPLTFLLKNLAALLVGLLTANIISMVIAVDQVVETMQIRFRMDQIILPLTALNRLILAKNTVDQVAIIHNNTTTMHQVTNTIITQANNITVHFIQHGLHHVR
jgi:hypothetical protein